VGDGVGLEFRKERFVAVFVCASVEHARVLGRWLYQDVEIEIRHPPDQPQAGAPALGEAAPHEPVAVLPQQGWRILLQDEANELGMLLTASRATTQSDRVRMAQRRLVELGLAEFKKLAPGGKPACFITDAGKDVALEIGRTLR
jgi:hypothetical protein